MSSSVGRNSAVMAAGTLASRLTGQIRTILLAAALGTTGIAANAYQTGSTIPQVLFTLLSGGVFNAVLVPQIVRTLKDKDAKAQLDKLITFAVILLFVVTVVMMGCSSLLTGIYIDSSWDPRQRALATSFTLWCMPQIFFYGLYTVLGQILAAQNRFGAYAWSSTGANVISCAGFVIFIALYGNASRQPLEFWTQDKIALLAGSWTAGVAFQALILFIPLIHGGYRWRFRLGVKGIGLKSMGEVAAWSLGIVLVDQLLGILTSRITNGAPLQGGDPYGIAGNGTYQNAFTLYILPYSLFAVSLATAVFPRLSEAIADGKTARASLEVSDCLCNLLLIIGFFTAAYLVEPTQITMSLLPSVRPEEVELIRTPLMLLTLASLPSSLILVLQRTFYAFKDGRTPFFYKTGQTVLQALIVIIGVAIFPPRDWVSVVAASASIAYLLTLPVVYVLIHHRLGLHDRRIAMTAFRTLCAALAAAAAGLLVTLLFRAVGWDALATPGMWLRWLWALLQAAIITIVMGAAYLGTLAALRTPQMAVAKATAARVVKRLTGRSIAAWEADGAASGATAGRVVTGSAGGAAKDGAPEDGAAANAKEGGATRAEEPARKPAVSAEAAKPASPKPPAPPAPPKPPTKKAEPAPTEARPAKAEAEPAKAADKRPAPPKPPAKPVMKKTMGAQPAPATKDAKGAEDTGNALAGSPDSLQDWEADLWAAFAGASPEQTSAAGAASMFMPPVPPPPPTRRSASSGGAPVVPPLPQVPAAPPSPRAEGSLMPTVPIPQSAPAHEGKPRLADKAAGEAGKAGEAGGSAAGAAAERSAARPTPPPPPRP